MKVLVDSTPVRPQPSGVGFYVKNLVVALQQLTIPEQFELETFYQPSMRLWLSSRRSAHELDSLGLRNQRLDIPVRLSSPLLRYCSRSAALKARVAEQFDQRFGAPQIVHGSNYSVFPSHRSRTVLNIHDLTFMRYPQFVDAMVKTYETRLRCCLNWTDLVITVSESSKQDIVHYLDVPPEKVWVTPLASQYQPARAHKLTALEAKTQAWEPQRPLARNAKPEAPSPTALYANRSVRYDLRRPFLLFVSTIEPRKNIVNLVKAFNILKDAYGIDHDLVLIGKKGWRYRPIFEEIARSPWRSQIFHLDYLPNDWVQQFYQRAEVFLYPSHYEGFGLPLLEAMTFGTPVVTSQTASLPEVAGDAALYAHPQDPEEIAHQTFRLLDDAELHQHFSERGRQRAQQFSWEATARETLRAYRSLNP